MAAQPHQQELLLGEVRSVLVRHLPVGMEGIGAAQTRAVMEVVSRRHTAADRVSVADDQREGLRMLRDLALGHRASSVLSPSQGTACTVCRQFPATDEDAAWPCPVWAVAVAMGVVGQDDEEFEALNIQDLSLGTSGPVPSDLDDPAGSGRQRKRRLFRR